MQIVVHEKMRYGIAILFLCLAGCSGRHKLPEPATHWTRSDDFGEYHGLYVFSQTADGKLWHTHYPEKSNGEPESSEHVGFWTESDGRLDWRFLNHSNATSYIMNTNGVYVEQDGSYYVPVELMPVPTKDGRLNYKE